MGYRDPLEAARAKAASLERDIAALGAENAELKELIRLSDPSDAAAKIKELLEELKELRRSHRAAWEQREIEFEEQVTLLRRDHAAALEGLRTKLVGATASNKDWERIAQFQSGSIAEHTPTIDLEDQHAVLSAMRTKTRARLMDLDLHALRHAMVDLETELRTRPADQTLQESVNGARAEIRIAEKETTLLRERLRALDALLVE